VSIEMRPAAKSSAVGHHISLTPASSGGRCRTDLVEAHLRDLRYFVAVADELSFTAAAARLFVSQPALSKQIRRLEQTLRVPLFDRDRRRVRLTPAGQALLPRARRLLADWDDAARQVGRADAAARQVLRIGVQTGIGRGLYPAVQARFAELRPGWRIDLRQHGFDDPTAGLLDGSSDAALLWLPLPAGVPFEHRVLVAEPRYVVLARAHRLASQPEVAFADVIDEPIVALPPAAGPLRDFWIARPERGGRSPTIAVEAHSPDEGMEAVAAGQAIKLMAAGNVELYGRPDVVARPVRDLGPAELAVVWRAGDTSPGGRAEVRAFVQACVDASADQLSRQ
jgi:DNA-binding transcriptional LysR family regulator